MANPQEFFGMMLPYAIEASRLTGIDPRIIVAQSALETGYGKSAPGNNYFGIKSHGKSGGNNLSTTEVINGKTVRINDSFRAYADPRDSALGYAEFINSNPRYGKVKDAQGFDAQLAALGASGYATDPNYTNKLRAIAAKIPMDGSLPRAQTPAPSAPAPAAAASPQPRPSTPPVASFPSSTAPTVPASTQPNIPAAVQAVAGAPTTSKSANDVFGMLAMMGNQGPQFSPVQTMGPSPEQATGLLQLVQALKSRIA